MLFEQLGVISYSPAQFVPAKKMDAEQTLTPVALGYRVNVRSKLAIVLGRGCNRKFRKRRLELDRFRDLIVDFLRRQFDRRPLTFSFALYACDPPVRETSANIAVLSLTQAAIADDVGIVPNPAKEIGANVLELIPVLGNGQLR